MENVSVKTNCMDLDEINTTNAVSSQDCSIDLYDCSLKRSLLKTTINIARKSMKSILILSFASLLYFSSWSQNLYLTASTGYNFGSNRANFENYTYNKLVSAFYPSTRDRFRYSLGKGMNLNVGIGYTTKYNIGFELEVSYLMGLKTIGKTEYIAEDVFKKEIYGRFYSINPSVHFINKLKKSSLKMYVSGLVGLGKMYLNQEEIYQNESLFEYENEFYGGYYIGFKAGIGVLHPINDRLNLSFDVNWINAYFSPDRAKVSKFVSGGNDYLDDLEPWEKEIVYLESLSKPPYNSNEPLPRLRENFAASSIGLQVGIQWNLWTKSKSKEEINE